MFSYDKWFTGALVLLSASNLVDARTHIRQVSNEVSWNTAFTQDALEEQLLSEPIDSIMSLSSFLEMQGRSAHASHTIRVITLKNGLVGIFKTGEYHYAEVAAYRLSKFLGFSLIPPAVYRTIEGKPGSLQLYIDASDLRSSSDPKKMLKKCGDEAIIKMKLFCYVAGQWDTHLGNQIVFQVADKYHLALIDNSGILHRSYSRYGGAQFIARGEENKDVITDMSSEFPFHKAKTVSKIDSELKRTFQAFLTTSHIRSLASEELTYVLWNQSLWIKWPSHKSGFSSFTRRYYSSVLDGLSKLTREHLELAWAELLIFDRNYVNDLISLTLKRRDEVIHHALSVGEIIED